MGLTGLTTKSSRTTGDTWGVRTSPNFRAMWEDPNGNKKQNEFCVRVLSSFSIHQVLPPPTPPSAPSHLVKPHRQLPLVPKLVYPRLLPSRLEYLP